MLLLLCLPAPLTNFLILFFTVFPTLVMLLVDWLFDSHPSDGKGEGLGEGGTRTTSLSGNLHTQFITTYEQY